MKKNKLNIDSFTNNEGKNYRRSDMLEKEEIKNYFSKKGYEVIQLQQIWRHVHGKLKKDNKIFFLKMASTPGIGERTQNETSWNQQIHEAISQANIEYFDVPTVYETGIYEGKFYYLSSFHEGPFLATKYPPKTDELEPWLEKIVRVNIFFLSLEDVRFLRDSTEQDLSVKWKETSKQLKNWYKKVKNFDLRAVLNIAKELEHTYIPSVNHGDFVPWHMIRQGNMFTLIDAEHASAQTPKYYDVAYFYNRLYTSARNPGLAKKYLGLLRQSLSEDERNAFDSTFRPILATRIIGGFWDGINDKIKDFSFHQKLKNDFINNALV